MSNRWLSIRVEFLGNFIVFFAAVFAFYLRHTLIISKEGDSHISISNTINDASLQGHSQRWRYCSLHLLCYADD